MHKTTIMLPDETINYLRDKAHAESTSIGELIRKSIDYQKGTMATAYTTDKSADKTVNTSVNKPEIIPTQPSPAPPEEHKEKPWVPVPSDKCDMPFCKQASIGTFKVATYNTDTGDEEKTLHLCSWHKNKARKEGNVTEL